MTKKLLVTCYMTLLGIGFWAKAGNDLMAHTSDGNFLQVHQLDEAPNRVLFTRYHGDGAPYDSLVIAATGELSVGFLVNGGGQTTILAGSYSGTLYPEGLPIRGGGQVLPDRGGPGGS